MTSKRLGHDLQLLATSADDSGRSSPWSCFAARALTVRSTVSATARRRTDRPMRRTLTADQLCRSRRHGRCRSPSGLPRTGNAQGSDPGFARLRRLPRRLRRAGQGLVRGRHRHLRLRPARFRQEPEPRLLGRHRHPGRGARRRSPAWSMLAIPACRSMWSAKAWAAADVGRRRSRPGGRRDGAERTGAARPRGVRAAGQRRPVVLRPHHPLAAGRSDLDRLQADRQPQDAR